MIATQLMEKNNSAGRLLRLFHENQGRAQNIQVLGVWAEAFGLPSNLPATDMAVEVSVLLGAVDRELQTIKATLLASGVPEGLVVQYIERGRSAVSTTLLPSSWNNVTQYFGQDTFLAFQWFSYLLAEDAQLVALDDVANLLEEMASLESEITTAELSPGLKQFMLSHLKAMQDALRLSRVAGAKPIQRAVRTVQNDFELEEEGLSAEVEATPDKTTARTVAESFAAIWKKAVDLSGDAEKIQKGAKVLTESAVALLKFINGPN